jgi:hypothetical protein
MSSNEQDPHDHSISVNWGEFAQCLRELEQEQNQHCNDDSEFDPEEVEHDYPPPDQDDDEHREEDQEEEDREEEILRQNSAVSPSDDCDRESSSEESKINQSCQDDSNNDGKGEAEHQ